MADIATIYNNEALRGDLMLDGGLLAMDEGLESAVLISLFTDRRATDAELVHLGGTDARGWWADLTLPDDGDQVGSGLWTLHREKMTTEVMRRAEAYAKKSLAWLITDGVATDVQVTAEKVRRGLLGLTVVITLKDGTTWSNAYNTAAGE